MATISLKVIKSAVSNCHLTDNVDKFETASLSNGYILYDGPSMIDGKPIVAIATGFKAKSDNLKTGKLIPIWIIRSDISPIIAVYRNENYSVCGDCKHRPNTELNPFGLGTCYVNIGQAVRAVFDTYKRGNYKVADFTDLCQFNDKHVRFGAYGEMTALPFPIVRLIASMSKRHVGYTHQWKSCDQRFKALLMASVDTPEEYTVAQFMGWRTFRCRTFDEPLQNNESMCPASEEAGKKTQCNDCMACYGGGNAKRSIAIIAHGSWKAKRFALIRKLQKMHKKFSHLIKVPKKTTVKRVHSVKG